MIYREQVPKLLQEKQETKGGYTGNDLTKLAKLLQVTSRGLRKRLSFWIKTDKQFSEFIYLGKEKPNVTLYEIFKINTNLHQIPFKLKKEFMKIFKNKEKNIIKNHYPSPHFIEQRGKKSFQCIVQKQIIGSK